MLRRKYMKIIKIIDHNDYHACTKTFQRTAIRAIIIQNNLLAMIQSKQFNECKFPGGGLEKGESHDMCLIREVSEETGLQVIPSSIKPYGLIKEKRVSYTNAEEIFEMDSYYYLAEVSKSVKSTHLDEYELNYGYELVWISIDDAIYTNEIAFQENQSIATWIERELTVLKTIKEEGLIK